MQSFGEYHKVGSDPENWAIFGVFAPKEFGCPIMLTCKRNAGKWAQVALHITCHFAPVAQMDRAAVS